MFLKSIVAFSHVSSHVHRSMKISLLNSLDSENDLPKLISKDFRSNIEIHFMQTFFKIFFSIGLNDTS
jgi:hypothetical protein